MKKNQNEKAEKNEAYMLRQIEESNQIVTLPEEEMDLYARVILYRVQKVSPSPKSGQKYSTKNRIKTCLQKQQLHAAETNFRS
ncbi:MAG: hypothetical protein HFE61_10960 [Anaerotignum sp.]|jgi:hypothetical protein|nr:hypothetical protein [Anaerotignum sp.]